MSLSDRIARAPAQQIGRQSASYRQGLVLGLTMAEIMLLLVFCLLIAFAAVFKVQQEAKAVLQRDFDKVSQDAARDRSFLAILQNNPNLAELLKKHGSNDAASDEAWRELVSNSQLISQFSNEGVTISDLRESAGDIKRIQDARRKGVDIERALAWSELVDALNQSFTVSGVQRITPQLVRETIAKGLASDNAQMPGSKWPPIIQLSEAGGYFFERGKAELSIDFQRSLETSVPARLHELIAQFDVDVIEVVGHTDEQPIGQRPSNLDRGMLEVIANRAPVSSLVSSDNAGLGLARAVAVVGVLARNPSLSKLRILPLSGAQLIQTDEQMITSLNPAADVRERRRIDIRLRKYVPQISAIAMPSKPSPRAVMQTKSVAQKPKPDVVRPPSAPVAPPRAPFSILPFLNN